MVAVHSVLAVVNRVVQHIEGLKDYEMQQVLVEEEGKMMMLPPGISASAGSTRFVCMGTCKDKRNDHMLTTMHHKLYLYVRLTTSVLNKVEYL